MPTGPESGHATNTNGMIDSCHSWTDDLPVCSLTGVGFATNQVYRKNGLRQEQHSFEDKSFHFRVSDDMSFYGIFDGHDGTKASHFAAAHLPAEVLLGQLDHRNGDNEITKILKQAVYAVEREYFETIADLLAEKTSLEIQLHGMNRYEAATNFPEMVDRLKSINAEVASGTTAVVALICRNKLYISNIGDSRAILCKTDQYGNFVAHQLSIDHDLNNTDELIRLSRLGLDVDQLRSYKKIGNQTNTRCIGNYLVKGGYKDFEYLASAKDEPVIAEPEICGGIPIDESCLFLILVSDGLFRALEEASGSHQVNRDICQLVTEEFRIQSTLTGVAQAVVNKVCRIHQDQYFASNENPDLPQTCQMIDDITLMVRNFNHPLLHGISLSPSGRSPILPFQRRLEELHISITEETTDDAHNYHNQRHGSVSNTLQPQPLSSGTSRTVTDTAEDTNKDDTIVTSNSSSTEFEERRWDGDSRPNDAPELDSEGKIAAYVNFDVFFKEISDAKSRGESVDIDNILNDLNQTVHETLNVINENVNDNDETFV